MREHLNNNHQVAKPKTLTIKNYAPLFNIQSKRGWIKILKI